MLRRFSMAVAEHPAESLTAVHAPDGIGRAGQWRDDRVAKSLVIPFPVVMRDALGDRGGRRTRSIPASPNRLRNAVVNLASRSMRQNLCLANIQSGSLSDDCRVLPA